MTWWNSRKARAPHRWPPAPMNAQHPRSRTYTCRFTSVGMYRVSLSTAPGLGLSVTAYFCLTRSFTSRRNARVTISAGSPVGTACLSRSWAHSSSSLVSVLPVNVIRYRLRRKRLDDRSRRVRQRRGRERHRHRHRLSRLHRPMAGSIRGARHRLRNRHGRGHAIRQSSHRERHVRLRKTPGQQLLDLPLAHSGRGHEEFLVVLARQVRRKQPDGREVGLAGLEQPKHDGVSMDDLRRPHAVGRLAVREPQDVRAVLEE
jgi:hypothetical protein